MLFQTPSFRTTAASARRRSGVRVQTWMRRPRTTHRPAPEAGRPVARTAAPSVRIG